MPNTLPLLTRHTKITFPVEKFRGEEQTVLYDVFVFVDFDNIIRYAVVDKAKFDTIEFRTVEYFRALKKMMTEAGVERFDIANIYGYWDVKWVKGKGNIYHMTLFLELRDEVSKVYLTQIDFDLFATYYKKPVIQSISKFWGREVLICGVMARKNFLYTDEKSREGYDTYIIYIEKPKEGLANKPVKGCRVLFTPEDKQEFISNHPELASEIDVESPIPVVDVWTEKDQVLYKLPSDAEKVKFDFSRGLVYVRFSEPNVPEYEQFRS